MTSVHRRRRELCDLLAGLTTTQWSAETLCAGWDAGDIAAHLIVREREPWTGPGLVLGGPLAALTDVRRRAWKARGRGVLLATLRSGPPWPLTAGPLAPTQIVEDWIHEQDVRRGGAGLTTPEPDLDLSGFLWRAAGRYAARTLAVDGDIVIELTDGDRSVRLRTRARLPLALSTSGQPDVTIAGPSGELLLYAVGRAGAQVTITGDEQARALIAGSARTV